VEVKRRKRTESELADTPLKRNWEAWVSERRKNEAGKRERGRGDELLLHVGIVKGGRI